ncbi:hypothetical protein Fmac_025825 [Flemingia macrophylla]|uniref:Uncharacterized protein n=1 Tax=Flemingia macrophylla TaxID=520843 RepID=A0ABD1LD45_9FABA
MNKVCVYMFVLVLVSVSTSSSSNRDEEEQRKKTSLWQWQTLRRAYSAYSALFPSNILNGLLTNFFRPNIDFRRGDEGVTAGEVANEALTKSIGTIGDAAKSAAHEVKNKKRKSLSDNKQTEHQNEL